MAVVGAVVAVVGAVVAVVGEVVGGEVVFAVVGFTVVALVGFTVVAFVGCTVVGVMVVGSGASCREKKQVSRNVYWKQLRARLT